MGNTATAVTVDDAGLDLSALAAGNQIEISPYWTLGTLFPASKAGVAFHASSSALLRATEILCFVPGAGINQNVTVNYYFYNGAWRRVGRPVSESHDEVVLPPDTFVKIRNNTGVAASKVTTAGKVLDGSLSTLLITSTTSKQDNLVAIPLAAECTLAQSGLISSGAFSASTSSLLRADELLIYSSTQTGLNFAPAETYYFYNGAWRKVGSPVSTSFDNAVVLRPGSAAIIRKAKAAAGSPGYAVWTFDTTTL